MSVKLSTGQLLPVIALGTWRSSEEAVYNAVLTALKAGYTHIDAASGYGNEAPIGRAIKDSGIQREKLFITTKVGPIEATDAESAIKRSLQKLQLDYLDLYLMHWPIAMNPNGNSPTIPTLPNGDRDMLLDYKFTDTWKTMETFVEKKWTKAIGVSNFTIRNLEILLKSANIKPAVNQVELHPYLPQHKLLKFCKDHNIVVEAYSPLGSDGSPILRDQTVISIAEKYNVPPATILISWAVQRGTVVLAKSVTPQRIIDNKKTIHIEEEDFEALNNIAENRGLFQRYVSPPWNPLVVFDTCH